MSTLVECTIKHGGNAMKEAFFDNREAYENLFHVAFAEAIDEVHPAGTGEGTKAAYTYAKEYDSTGTDVAVAYLQEEAGRNHPVIARNAALMTTARLLAKLS